MQTFNDLPLYWAVIRNSQDPDEGLGRISLVDKPAIEREFVAMNSAKKITLSRVVDEDKRLVYGVILRANFPIYRNSREMGEFYVAFTPESIRETVEKFFADKRAGEVNIMHRPDSQVEGVNLIQMFIKNSAAGVSPAGFEDIEEGSLFGEYHVTNDRIWAAIKAGDYRGFSIEGNFFFTQNQHLKPQNNAMSTMERIKARLAKMLVELGAVTTDKGPIFWDGEDDLKAGFGVFVEDEEGERKPAPDGSYKTEDGKTIKISEGKVAEIVDPKAEVGAAAAAPDGQGAAAADDTARRDVEDVKKRLEDTERRIAEIEKSLEKVLDALEKSNTELRELKKTPAAVPAHTAFTAGGSVTSTGDPQLDRLARMMGE